MVLIALLLFLPPEGLTLSVSARPRILLFGGDVRVECRVPRAVPAESVTWGMEGPGFYRSSTQSHDRVVYDSMTRLPQSACGTFYAFCSLALADNLGEVHALPQSIIANGVGCDLDP